MPLRPYRPEGSLLPRSWVARRGKTMKRISAAMSLALFLGLLLPSTASAVTDRTIVPYGAVIESCSGENISLSGELLLITHVREDSSGGLHAQVTFVPREVLGVSASGTRYRQVVNQVQRFNLSGQGTLTGTFTTEFMLISEGGTDNLLERATTHVTITPDGDVTADVNNVSFKCVG
jgi:hypothetical protein